MSKVKVKVARNVGLRTGLVNGKENFENVFFNVDASQGTTIEMSDKDYKYHLATIKRVEKSQEMLKKLFEGSHV